MVPTVDTRQTSCSAEMFWMARTSLEALTKASRRIDIGVVPAWLAFPSISTSNTDLPVIPVTTPMCEPD